MPMREIPLRTGYVYHILSRGINHSPIFNQSKDYQRFLELIQYCHYADYPFKFSFFKTLSRERRQIVVHSLKEKFVSLISYCLMPNHFHLVLRQEKEEGIVSFINRVLISYSKYLNTKYKRKGPLFESRFKAILVETDNQLIHLVRYVHLNPYSSVVVKTLDEIIKYPWSSFSEYLNLNASEICDNKQIVLSHFKNIEAFKTFTYDQADYQRKLQEIKHLLWE